MHEPSVVDRGHITSSPSTRNHTNTSQTRPIWCGCRFTSASPPAAESASLTNFGCIISMIVSRFTMSSRLYFSSSSSASALPRSYSCQSRTASKPVIPVVSALRVIPSTCLIVVAVFLFGGDFKKLCAIDAYNHTNAIEIVAQAADIPSSFLRCGYVLAVFWKYRENTKNYRIGKFVQRNS